MRIFLIALIFLLGSFSLLAQYGSFGITDARSVGMGNTYTASSYGVFSMGKNPALLSSNLDDSKSINILLPKFLEKAVLVDEAN